MSADHAGHADDGLDDEAYFRDFRAAMPGDSQRVIGGLERVKSVYVDCPRDEALLTAFNRFLEQFLATRSGRRDEADIFFLPGASGAGKSLAVERLLREHPALQPKLTSYGLERRCVSIKLRGYTHPRLVGLQIIRAAGYGMGTQTARGEVWDGMADHLRAQRVSLVHVDEAQHLLKANASLQAREELAEAIKGVSIDRRWPVAFLFSGLPRITNLAGGDEQVERRGNFVRFDDVRMPDERDLVVKIIERLAEPVGLDVEHLVEEASDLPWRLAHAANRRYARICQGVVAAIQEALHWKNARLTVGHFADAYERRSLAYGRDEKNPFVEQHWKELRPGAFLEFDEPKADPQ
ncbi:ATP-binding protein [Methylobacterium sp. 285MFTsu5.1]|uniref:ATP-binding protein n=1 Tax=Methylobacterium sp. 285MFTsu5.1 TaxID=1172187 RepID=UPI00036BA8E0|nr:ATP-binding protein [Methylobacterium sp. 285MFTsu5.1]